MFNQSSPNFWDGLPALDLPRPKSVPKYEFTPAEAEKEAQEILKRARDEAATTIKQAEDTAQILRENALVESVSIKSEALERGEMEGYERARQEVQTELFEAWNERVEALRADIESLIDSIIAQRKVLWEQSEPEINAFVIEMAKKVVKVEIEQNKKVIAEMIRHSLRRVVDKENIRIRVSPDELSSIRAERKDLLLVLDGARQLEIVDDRRIGRGGCVIETSAGTVDARVETQFEQIADKLGVIPLSGEAEE